ncbi:MAG: aminotransferase class V-fold PLP-dependent enzyme [Reichenbachiella sp.]
MKCQRSKFQLSKKTAFLNCANMGPLMKKVVKAGRKGIARKCQPNKITGEDFFREVNTLKVLFSKLINNPDPNRISIIPSVSYGIATVAKNISLKKGEKVIVTEAQFPSNIYAWKSLCQKSDGELITVPAPKTTDNRGKKWNAAVLKAIDKNTKVVAIGNVHWSDGTLFDLMAIRKKTTTVGAALIVDGTQSIGALPFDLQSIQPDALIVAGYKWLMGPYSNGLAYFGSMFDDGDPIEYSWINRKDSDKFSHLVNYEDEFQEKAIRYDMGEKSNFILNPMLIESLKQVNKWGPENIQEYCKNLIAQPVEEIKKLGYYIEDSALRSAHIFGVKIPKGKLENVQKALKHHRVAVSFRGDFVRVSPHLYNDERDMKKLVKAFKMAISN